MTSTHNSSASFINEEPPPSRPVNRVLKFLRKVFVPSQEELARDLTAVGYGMAFSPPVVHYG